METVKKITQDADFPLKSNLEQFGDYMLRSNPIGLCNIYLNNQCTMLYLKNRCGGKSTI